MQVIISTRGMTVSKTYKDAVTRRLVKLMPMVPKPVETKVVLSKEKDRRTAALTLVAKRHTFRSRETARDLVVAVDMAVDALTRQVRALKERLKVRKGRATPRRAGAAGAPAPAIPLVAIRRVTLEPMPIGEAVERLRRAGDPFLYFRNALTDAPSVLYRRGDGGFELLEPQL